MSVCATTFRSSSARPPLPFLRRRIPLLLYLLASLCDRISLLIGATSSSVTPSAHPTSPVCSGKSAPAGAAAGGSPTASAAASPSAKAGGGSRFHYEQQQQHPMNSSSSSETTPALTTGALTATAVEAATAAHHMLRRQQHQQRRQTPTKHPAVAANNRIRLLCRCQPKVWCVHMRVCAAVCSCQ